MYSVFFSSGAIPVGAVARTEGAGYGVLSAVLRVGRTRLALPVASVGRGLIHTQGNYGLVK